MKTLNLLTVRAEIVGRRGPAFSPLKLERDFAFETARDLLCAIVSEQLDAFSKRKEDSHLLHILSAAEMDDGKESGRIVSGGQDRDTRIPLLTDAIEAAVQAFEDGFYYIFVNDVQIQSLDQPLDHFQHIDVLFIRLTPLVGG
jgi:hypothetical protein